MKPSPDPRPRASRLARLRLTLIIGVAWVALIIAGRHVIQVLGIAYNLTPSIPRGLYFLRPLRRPLEPGQLVALNPPESIRELLIARGYLKPGAMLFKRIVAGPGDQVCISDGGGFVAGGVYLGPVFRSDRGGLPLPVYRFCGAAPAGQYFVGTPYTRSFDSRYFGPIVPSQLRGSLVPLWTF